MNQSSNAKEIVLRYQRALGKSDWDGARRFLRDDMSFKGPLARHDRPEGLLQDLKNLRSIVRSVDMKKVFVDGDDVCLLYDMHTNSPAGTAFVSEWYHVQGDKIASLRVVFDARAFAAMMEKK